MSVVRWGDCNVGKNKKYTPNPYNRPNIRVNIPVPKASGSKFVPKSGVCVIGWQFIRADAPKLHQSHKTHNHLSMSESRLSPSSYQFPVD